MPVVVLAGGRPDDKVAATQGKAVKALVELEGRPIVSYVVDALAGAGMTPIWAATSVDAAAAMHESLADAAQILATPGPHFTDTLQVGLTAVGDVPKLLLCTGDLPLLTPEAVTDFVHQALATGGEIVYSTVPLEGLKPPYAGAVRTKVRLREGKMSGGNLVLASPAALKRTIETIQQAFLGRKSPFALAKMFGFSFIVGYLLGTLDIPRLRNRGREILGCSVDVVVSEYAEVCFDMDSPEHLDLAQKVLDDRAKRRKANT